MIRVLAFDGDGSTLRSCTLSDQSQRSNDITPVRERYRLGHSRTRKQPAVRLRFSFLNQQRRSKGNYSQPDPECCRVDRRRQAGPPQPQQRCYHYQQQHDSEADLDLGRVHYRR
jgi:hypothetical protein